MRQNKFRVWLEEIKTMQYSDKLSSFFKDYEDTKQPMMQFTGLKDMNGRKIYEGDIVQVFHPQDTTGDFTGTHGQVFYDVTEAAWYHSGHNGRPPKRMWKYCTVVGNIYENPEPIKGDSNE